MLAPAETEANGVKCFASDVSPNKQAGRLQAPQAACRLSCVLLTCFGFSFPRCRACGAGTGRNLGAGAAAGVLLHVYLRAVSGA